MSPEAQRIAIAEACGWWGNRNGLLMRPPLNNSDYCEVPVYLNDLNAMHEAIGSRSRDERIAIAVTLRTMCRFDRDELAEFATAAQQAEAFLRTLNLWTE